MLYRQQIEKFDATYGIPRKANEQYLPAYQAFWHWTADVGRGFVFFVLGLVGAFLSLLAGWLLGVAGLITLVFWAMALLCLAGSLLDAYSLLWSYRIRRMSTAHGSARWARTSDLIRCGLMNKMRGLIPSNAMPIARAFGGRDIYLPQNQWLRHFVMFGPTGSGKSKTFFISMLRAILKGSSCLVYDPKGELCEQTALSARRIFRLDLNDPAKSDRWNFIPKCRNDPAFACQIAGMMIGVESRRRTNADPFWGDAEQIALTAILLHIAEVYCEKAIPAFAADFLLSLGEDTNGAFAKAMSNSPSFYAKQAYMAFRQAPQQTRGSILIGLYNKLRPFTLAPARMVTTTPSDGEKNAGCRLIDFSDLRRSGTAIYLVISEGASDIYKEFIATFLGQAVMEMRLDGINDPKHPCFVLIDEAYQLNVSEVKRISGIGRGRGVGLGLGYQDLPQMYDQYGRERANAILGTVMTKIFLPGLDDVTAEYASKQIGDTTVLSKTFQDFPGKKNDNTRYAEQKRSLMHSSEIRQIAAHQEVLIVNDTAPPIRAAYLPFAVQTESYIAKAVTKPRAIYLGEIDAMFDLKDTAPTSRNRQLKAGGGLITQAVGQVLSDKKLLEIVAKDQNPDETIDEFREENALDDLVEDVRDRFPEYADQSRMLIAQTSF